MTTAVFEQLSSPRILRGTRADIWLATYLDGEPTAPATPAPTVSVADQDGTVVASGTATISTVNKRLEFTLTAAQTASSAQLTATWTDVKMGTDPVMTLTSYHEICGDVLFTIPEARMFDAGVLANQTKFPPSLILDARDRIWDEFESILGNGDPHTYRLGGRVQRETLSGDGSTGIWLASRGPITVTGVSERTTSTLTWTAFTSTYLNDLFANNSGFLTRESLGYWTLGNRNFRITYEAGAVPIPSALKRAALLVLKDQLIKNDIPSRATSQTNEFGTFQLSTPGQRGAEFGIPAVDVVLNRMKANLPGFA